MYLDKSLCNLRTVVGLLWLRSVTTNHNASCHCRSYIFLSMIFRINGLINPMIFFSTFRLIDIPCDRYDAGSRWSKVLSTCISKKCLLHMQIRHTKWNCIGIFKPTNCSLLKILSSRCPGAEWIRILTLHSTKVKRNHRSLMITRCSFVDDHWFCLCMGFPLIL